MGEEEGGDAIYGIDLSATLDLWYPQLGIQLFSLGLGSLNPLFGCSPERCVIYIG